jgi:hypothetical protein
MMDRKILDSQIVGHVNKLCPDCNYPATLVKKQNFENRILVFTYQCPKGHSFSTKQDMK